MAPSSNQPHHSEEDKSYCASDKHTVVTVMFVDVIDSTGIFENIDPEYVHQIMVGCFEILLNEVHKHMGTINQFRGDCAMAIFSSTSDLDNHAFYACQAAQAIIGAIEPYGRKVQSRHNIPFQVRIGINTGLVTIGSIANDLQIDFVADCKTTLIASLLESNAHPGKILISSSTRKLVKPFFNLRPCDHIDSTAQSPSLIGFELISKKTSAYQYYKDSNRPIETYTPKHLVDKILTTRSSIEGERKYVTVMFVGMTDAATVYENIDPRLVNRIMDDCFKILRNQIYSLGGIINQFRGDCVMAIFGAPVAYEDHAARACHAALNIMRAMYKYRSKIEKEFRISPRVQIGLNTGQVVVGSIGNNLRMDYTADGDTSNLAARLQAHAKPGTTLISPKTFQRIGKLFKLRSLGKISIKGKQQPIEVYALLGIKQHRPRLGVERRIYSEMVGRNEELKTLENQLQKLLDGSGTIINIIGEAGIGKSRLVAELMNFATMNSVTVLEGKAISIGTSLSFYPLIDLLKNWAQIHQEDDQRTAFEKLETAIQKLSPQQSEEIIPFISTLMGMELVGGYAKRVAGITGEALENLIFKNFRELLIQISASAPVVIFMEDLHWADLSTIGFLESIFHLAQHYPILFINPLRPGYQQTTERLIKLFNKDAKDYYLEITLSSLDSRSSMELIDNIFKIDTLPVSLINQVVERSDGNPYFIEEVVRSFIDEGVLVDKDGVFMSTDKIHHVVIPNTITDLLTARIDRLEEKHRDLIKTASVIGRSFFYRILKHVAESGNIDLQLAYLKDIQMIFERQRLEEIEYLFTHALAQEAAYESILFEKRRPLHLKVAQSVEHLFAENLHDFYGLLAFHYSKGDDFYKAEEYLLKSGEVALKSSASSEAILFFKEGLRLYQNRLGSDADPDKVAYMQRCIAISYYNKGQLVDSLPFLKKALHHYGVRESKSAFYATIKAIVCFLSFILRLYVPALRKNKVATETENLILDLWFKKTSAYGISDKVLLIREGIRSFNSLSNYNLRSVENGTGFFVGMSIICSYGGISFYLGKKILARAKPQEDGSDPKGAIYYQVAKLLHAFFSGNLEKNLRLDENLVTQNLKLGEVLFTTYYYIHLIFQHIEKGNFNDVVELIEGLGNIIEAYRCDYSKSNLFYVTARLLLKMRKIPLAINAAEKSIAHARTTGDLLVLSQTYSILARMHVLMGDLDSAEMALSKAEGVNIDRMYPLYSSEVFLSRFVINVAMMDTQSVGTDEILIKKCNKQTLKSGKKAAQIIKKAAYNSVELYRYTGLFFWRVGQKKNAFKFWGKSIEKGNFMGTRPELARTYFEVGRHLADLSGKTKKYNGLDAQSYLNLSKKMFEDMDLRWDLDQLKQFNSRSVAESNGE